MATIRTTARDYANPVDYVEYNNHYTDGSGGGICGAWNEGYPCASNCRIIGNSASDSGGGAYICSLNNLVVSNTATYRGGGIFGGSLTNCTIVCDSAQYGGGAVIFESTTFYRVGVKQP